MSQAEQSQALVVPKSLIWNSSHAAVFALNSIGACLFDRDFWVVTMILTVPLAIGAVQVFLLDKILHWRVLWPIASVFERGQALEPQSAVDRGVGRHRSWGLAAVAAPAARSSPGVRYARRALGWRVEHL